MQLSIASIQQYIVKPTLVLWQIVLPLIENSTLLILAALGVAVVVLVSHALHAVLPGRGKTGKLRHARVLKLTIADSIKKGKWDSWVTPLTSIGGLLGIIILVHTDQVFTDLSMLFGAMLLVAPLVSKVMDNWIGVLITTGLTLWAAIGEVFATLALLVNLDLSSPIIAVLIWGIVVFALVLSLAYAFQKQNAKAKLSGKKAAFPEDDPLSDSFVALRIDSETHSRNV